jgi:Flp pilus assembly protein TadG
MVLRLPARSGTGCKRRGAAAIEFAMVAPVAFLLILASVEFGRAMFVHMLAVNAARAACRQAVIGRASNEAVLAEVKSFMQELGIRGAEAKILVDGLEDEEVGETPPGVPVTVTVTIPYTENAWVPNPFYLAGKRLSGTVTMSKE